MSKITVIRIRVEATNGKVIPVKLRVSSLKGKTLSDKYGSVETYDPFTGSGTRTLHLTMKSNALAIATSHSLNANQVFSTYTDNVVSIPCVIDYSYS